ncbi:MAG TPA: hypothetical protein VFQ39_03105, partial [Longimicrobium sp.]|nr:hypothetical protein [Longimicrobium sp.]
GGDSTYTLSNLDLRTELGLGASVWGGLERADAGRAEHSAVLGWSQRLAIAGGWSLNGMYERRFGLSRAPLLDPVRALPFAQPERNRWSAGLGVEYLPADSAAARFSVRGETHDGELGNGYRIDVAGDLPVGRSAALLTRHDWLLDDRQTGRGFQLERRDRSLVGLALRPVASDAFNLLAKMEYRRTISPLGGALLGIAGDQRRLIGATDAVWAPAARTELALRYAVRWATAGGDSTVVGDTELATLAQYFGLRGERTLTGPLGARLDGRALLAGEGGAEWNLAPSLLFDIGPQLRLEAGYRFGGLEDPDFAAQGGRGFFATLGVRFSERLLDSAAAFWRERVNREP